MSDRVPDWVYMAEVPPTDDDPDPLLGSGLSVIPDPDEWADDDEGQRPVGGRRRDADHRAGGVRGRLPGPVGDVMSDLAARPCVFVPAHEPWSCSTHPGGYRVSLNETVCRAAQAETIQPMTVAEVEEFDRWAESRRGRGVSLGMLWALRLRATLIAANVRVGDAVPGAWVEMRDTAWQAGYDAALNANVRVAAPPSEDAARPSPRIVITVCPHSVDTRFTTCLLCEKAATAPPSEDAAPLDAALADTLAVLTEGWDLMIGHTSECRYCTGWWATASKRLEVPPYYPRIVTSEAGRPRGEHHDSTPAGALRALIARLAVDRP